MWSARLALGHAAALRADHHRELGLPVERDVLRWGRDVVVRSGEGLGELREQGREVREVAAHLEDVRAVVEPDADHLAGARHDWRQVEVAQSVSLAVGLLGHSAPPGLAEELPHVARVGELQLDDLVVGGSLALDPADGGATLGSSESHEPHAWSSWMRLSESLSMMGWSPKRKRSRPASAAMLNGVHEGTTTMSPFSTVCSVPPSTKVPVPSKTW